MESLSAKEVIEKLKLLPHPEGGFYREVHRSTVQVRHPGVPDDEDSGRVASTSIYFLLEKGDYSVFHRVRSEETWCLFAGGPIELHLISQHGDYSCHVLARDIGAGFATQLTIPPNVWQAARPSPNVDWVLCGCHVAPGFEFADFSMASRKELLLCYPKCEDIVKQLTRP